MSMDAPYVRIVLKQVEVTVRIGLATWERERPQRLLVNVELYAEERDYLQFVKPGLLLDYFPIYKRIQSWRARAHVDLVETFVSELLEVCFEDPQVIACRVSVLKPEVLDQAGAAGAEAFMTRKDYGLCMGGWVIRARDTQQA